MILAACAPLPPPEAADTFTAAGVLAGAVSTRERCVAMPESTWVVVDGRGDCIRAFAGGLEGGGDVGVVSLPGDLLLRAWDGGGNTIREMVVPAYRDITPDRMTRIARADGDILGRPFFWIGRPGTFGSSGDHHERRRPREALLVNGAIDELARAHRLRRLVLVGQSGGGHVVAALLTLRQDILCAVAASAPLAVAERIRLMGWTADATGYRDFYDPIDHVAEIRARPDLRIFILGDERDEEVPFATEEHYFARLKARGLDAHLIRAKGAGPDRHGLEATAFTVARWCADGMPTPEILERAKGLSG